MLFVEVVATARDVAATSSRTAKRDALAALLRRMSGDEALTTVGVLTGVPRQGRIGVGWATIASLEAQHASTPTLTIGDVDDALEQIVATTGKGSTEQRAQILSALFARATADEADLIRRLLTGEMRQGALAGVMTDAIAAAAAVPVEEVRRAAMLGGDLGDAARVALTAGTPGLRAVGLRVLRPVEPMLASTASDLADALTGASSVEWKLDGIRIQAHRLDDQVRVFTRNLNDVTERVPGVVDAVRAMPARALVLDGEAIALDDEPRPHLFQETMSNLGRRTSEPMLRAQAFFFDVLHADGTDLIDEPLRVRLDALASIAAELRMPGTLTDDPAVAQGVLDDALAAGHEGVMVKTLDSPYQAGRRGKAWRKVKPVTTLDLVVIAAEWGHGRRTGRLSNLHLGARAEDGYVMVGKTFKGLTDQMLRWQTEQLLARETSRSSYVVHVRPEVVVEIALDGVQVSRRYPGGVALRFARVVRYRDDKRPKDADTIEAVRALLAR